MLTFALDVPTLSLMSMVVTMFGAGGMVFLSYSHRNERGLYDLAFGSSLLAVGMALYPFRGVLPNLFSMVLPNYLFMLGPVYFWSGFRQLLRRPFSRRPMLLWATASLPFFLYFTLVDYQTNVRVVVFSIFHCVIIGMVALDLFRKSDEAWAGPRLFIATAIAAHVVYTLIRGFVAATVGTGDAVRTPGLMHGLAFVDAMLISMAVTFGCAILTSQRLQAHLNRVARTDDLTGAYNRRALAEAAEAEVRRTERHTTGLAVLILDIDHFKKVNDRYGHVAGDEVLRHFVLRLREGLRAEDLVGRMGGEEFCVVLVDAASRQVPQVGERLRRLVEEMTVSWDKGAIRITTSIGIAVWGLDGAGFDELYKRADERLYRAKAEGRNRAIGPMTG